MISDRGWQCDGAVYYFIVHIWCLVWNHSDSTKHDFVPSIGCTGECCCWLLSWHSPRALIVLKLNQGPLWTQRAKTHVSECRPLCLFLRTVSVPLHPCSLVCSQRFNRALRLLCRFCIWSLCSLHIPFLSFGTIPRFRTHLKSLSSHLSSSSCIWCGLRWC